jgi:hypothetical protein
MFWLGVNFSMVALVYNNNHSTGRGLIAIET